MKILTDIEFLFTIANDLGRKRLQLVQVKTKKEKIIGTKNVNYDFSILDRPQKTGNEEVDLLDEEEYALKGLVSICSFLVDEEMKRFKKEQYEDYILEIGIIKGRTKENNKIALEMYNELLHNLPEMLNQ